MKIINADFIYTPNGYIQNHAVAFTQTIQEIAPLEVLTERYPDAIVCLLYTSDAADELT